MKNEVGRDNLGRLIIDNEIINSFDIIPNVFEDMISMASTNSIKVRLFDIISPSIPRDANVEFSVKSIYKDDAFLLVFGGWIPCAFIKNKTIILADRNIVTEIVSRYANGKKKNNTPMDVFDSIFLCNKHTIDITLFVLEGNERKIPDDNKLDEQVISVTNSLKLALPNLNIARYSNNNGYYYKVRDNLACTIKKRMIFLQEISPKLNKQFNQKSRELAVKQVFLSAERVQLERNDISVMLALLRITMTGKKTAAQLVLKDSQVYSEENSYNAACDLTAIELLVNIHKFHRSNNSEFNIAILTKDKGLSLFASLLMNAEVIDSSKAGLSITTRIGGAIFGDDPTVMKMYEDWFAGNLNVSPL